MPTSTPSTAERSDLLDGWLHAGEAAVAERVAVATHTAEGWTGPTYAELDQRSRAVAAWLAGAGVGKGDPVALLGEAGGDWVAGLLGILRRGAVAVLLDAKATAEELGPLAERSELTAAIVSPTLLRRWRPAVPVLASTDTQPRHPASGTGSTLGDLTSPRTGATEVPRDEDDPAVLVWTSGTTGEPKGVTLSLANLAYVVDQLGALQQAGPQARLLSVLPPSHLLELCGGLLPALAAGATTFLAGTMVPHELVALIEGCAIDRMVVVPLVLQLLKRHLEVSGATLPSLPAFYCGGAPLDPEVITFFERLGTRVFQGYGLTEAAPAVAMNSAAHHRLGSVGRPLQGTTVRIAGDGEILVQGPGIMLGYWPLGTGPGHDERGTGATVDADGWLHTGDLGHLDEDGFLYVTGRAKAMIVLDSGKKVQPEEVEAALARGPLFVEVAVVGLRGPARHGEQVCAVVVPSRPIAAAAAEEEVARLTAGLSGYKRPTLVRVHQGELPRTAKRSLRRADIIRLLERAEETGAAR
ncbi:MAG TPA: AMP-binding protein [Acidimicrobiales bacterium]|nr:AMP-binding protein [Acidimicrobiales bacterium]